MNWDLITQGLELSVMGILTTFMALGLFIGIILLLRRVFPVESAEPMVMESAEEPALVFEAAGEDADAVAAAIGAAFYVQKMLAVTSEDGIEASFVPQSYRPRRKGLGARLEEPRGRWWHPEE